MDTLHSMATVKLARDSGETRRRQYILVAGGNVSCGRLLSLAPPIPLQLDALVIKRPDGSGILPPVVKDPKAQELYDAYDRANEHVHAVDQAEKDAQLAVRRADQALTAEVERSAAAGEVSKLDADLLRARESANAAAHPDIHEARRPAAQALADTATSAYLWHVDAHALNYTETLRPEAEKVAAEVNRLQAEHEKRLQPLRDKHAELLQAFTFALGGTAGLTGQDIVNELAQPVAIRPDVLRRLQGVPEPTPNLAPEPLGSIGPRHHGAPRLRHRHRPRASRLRREGEGRPSQPLPHPRPPAAARRRRAGASDRGGAGAACRHHCRRAHTGPQGAGAAGSMTAVGLATVEQPLHGACQAGSIDACNATGAELCFGRNASASVHAAHAPS